MRAWVFFGRLCTLTAQRRSSQRQLQCPSWFAMLVEHINTSRSSDYFAYLWSVYNTSHHSKWKKTSSELDSTLQRYVLQRGISFVPIDAHKIWQCQRLRWCDTNHFSFLFRWTNLNISCFAQFFRPAALFVSISGTAVFRKNCDCWWVKFVYFGVRIEYIHSGRLASHQKQPQLMQYNCTLYFVQGFWCKSGREIAFRMLNCVTHFVRCSQ